MPKLTTYLKNLKFDPQLKQGFFAKYLQNTRLAFLVVLLVFLIGIFSFSSLPRVLNPQIKIPIVIVSTVLPGASPKDVESLVTIPVEDSVSSLAKVKTVTSTSQDSVSVVTLEFESGVDPDKAKSDVKSAVDSVTTLPKDAKTSNVQKLDFENTPVWTFSLSSKGDYLSLVRFGKILRDALKELPTVDRVETSGLNDEEIQVLINPAKLATYGISPVTLSQSIQAATGSFPAGAINTDRSSFVLSIDPTVTTVENLRKIRISANGTTFLLSDVADVQRRPLPNGASSYIASNSQQPVKTIRFDVFKASSANITQAINDAKKLSDKTIAPYKEEFTISTVLNSGEKVDKQFFDLVRDLLVTVALVFITLFLFLGLRQAVVASFAIPLTFLITFIVMNVTGMSLSFIAFFSLLLSLGLLVDDTIVVISALTAYHRTKRFTPLETGLLVWRDFKTAITTTTLTTVWAFVPLLLSTGIIGEFIKAIPIVVSSTLLGSFVVAIFITFPFLIFLLGSKIPRRVVLLLRILGVIAVFWFFMAIAPKGIFFLPALILFVLTIFVYFQVRYLLFKKPVGAIKNKISKKSVSKLENFIKVLHKLLPSGDVLQRYVDHGVINFEKISKKYRAILTTILSKAVNRKKTVLVVAIFSIFSYLLLPLGFVKNEFFPKSDQEFLYVSLEYPAGTNLSQTNQEMLNILQEVHKMPDVSFAIANSRLSVDPGRGYAGSGDNTALITLVLPPLEKRHLTSMDIAEKLREIYKNYSKGTLSVVEVSGGPPAGADLQIKLSGNDLAVLDKYANKLQDYLKAQSTTTNVSKSIKSGTSKIVFVPDYQKMLDADITEPQIGLWLRTYASGFTLEENAKLQQGTNESQDIVLRTAVTPETVSALNTISIPVKNGPPVLLSSLGHFELRNNPTVITREKGKRTISVTAGVKKGVSSTEESKKLEKFADSMNLPEGYSWSTGGANEENQNSVKAIMAAMLLSFLLIVITMVLQFNSFRKAFIVMLVIPLSISGVFIIFSLTQTPLSFPALIGVLALFGIVVKNAILIVDKINQNIKQKMDFKEAIVDASESRLEPITLTTFATIIGLIPITLSDPLWQGLGGAIIAGLFFSGSMMLFFIPVVYYLMFNGSTASLVQNS
ncbi:efflux RND transporter permease subunit [Candidatus Roizmanbacteria bacterium]|nr:efflux RND transporter permease subunit [Candidatus Roizmanbacteria bacterium]